eukprot:TRINITY_DN1906_c0_g1_i16.p1 TRINITY_DN1906_c0_g1~~TRINITY_DN1906_c0_g1_i16.p1  ORF type:complete len:412 (+),score=80.11 TRINITY_DN1906_c0_g1_i16:75-1310(+)
MCIRDRYQRRVHGGIDIKVNQDQDMTKTLLILSAILYISLCKTKEEWKSRVIYQLLTDRFAKDTPTNEGCQDLRSYCGGTFQGIMKNLDYIQEMGFNAIWISPVVENVDDNYMGYHGYHAKNFYKINPKFGTEEDLKALVDDCHKRDVWVMVDVVTNHIGPLKEHNYSQIFPFNKPEYYHNSCEIKQEDYLYNQQIVEDCWLHDLPDLNQSHPFVREQLNQWIRWLVDTFKFDGIRISSIPNVPKDFWVEFVQSAGVFSIGENSVDIENYVYDYLDSMDSVLNYPGYNQVVRSFNEQGSLLDLEQYLKRLETVPKKEFLGSFLDNHDNKRFLNVNPSFYLLRNAIVFTFAQYGIPIIYSGTEQGFRGGDDPFNREVMWGRMFKESDVYQYCLLYTSPSPRDRQKSRMPSSA